MAQPHVQCAVRASRRPPRVRDARDMKARNASARQRSRRAAPRHATPRHAAPRRRAAPRHVLAAHVCVRMVLCMAVGVVQLAISGFSTAFAALESSLIFRR